MAGARELRIKVDGVMLQDILDDLIELEVVDSLEEHPSFCASLVIRKRDDGSWSHLDSGDETVFALWQRITVEAGFGSDVEVIFDGYVSGISPMFLPDESDCHLLVWGYGASWAMAQEEKVVSWADKTFSEIATTIFQSYGLTPKVDDSTEQHKEAEYLLLQRGTDWDYVRELGRRLGYEVFVEGAIGTFRKPLLTGTVQKDIAAFFGPTASNLVRFTPVVRAGMPTSVTLSRINSKTKAVETSAVTESPLLLLAKRDGVALRSGRSQASGTPTVLTATAPVSSKTELDALTGALRQDGDWLVEGEGEVDGNLYGQLLRARRLVNIKGVGEDWSGTWYVCQVLHRFRPKSYAVNFRVQRNGLGLKGSESFQAVKQTSSALDTVSIPPVTVAKSGRLVKP